MLSEKPSWPPDVFAVAATLLRRSGAYRAVANAWPPPEYVDTTSWHRSIAIIASRWQRMCDEDKSDVPVQVKRWWEEVTDHLSFPVSRIAEDKGLFTALVGLVACADQTCGGFGFLGRGGAITRKEGRAQANLSTLRSLCEMVHPSRCSVLPKAHNPYAGMTLRSLTHNLALWDRSEVSAAWESVKIDIPNKSMNVLLVPWPLKIDANAFHPANECHELRLPSRVGLFEYDMSFRDSDVNRVVRLVNSEAGPLSRRVFG